MRKFTLRVVTFLSSASLWENQCLRQFFLPHVYTYLSHLNQLALSFYIFYRIFNSQAYILHIFIRWYFEIATWQIKYKFILECQNYFLGIANCNSKSPAPKKCLTKSATNLNFFFWKNIPTKNFSGGSIFLITRRLTAMHLKLLLKNRLLRTFWPFATAQNCVLDCFFSDSHY